MRYWVYGVDGATKEPRDPLFIEADSEQEVRKQAIAEGMQIEEVEEVQPRATGAPPILSPAEGRKTSGEEIPGASGVPPFELQQVFGRFFESGHILAPCLVVALRILAVLATIWWVLNTVKALETANAIEASVKELSKIEGKGISQAAPASADALQSAASWRAFSAFVYGAGLVTILLALAEGLRLAILIEGQSRRDPEQMSRDKP